MTEKEANNLTEEILSSERIGSYMAFAYGLGLGALPDNPSWVWEQLRLNPWVAMAVYEDIEEKDDMVAACLEARKDNVLAKDRRVIPASDKRQDKKIAEFIEETLEGYFDPVGGDYFGFEHVLWEAMDAIGKGVAMGEIIYGNASDRLYIKDVRFKPQHLFSFGEGMMAAYAVHPSPQTGPLRLRPGIFIEGVSSEDLLPEKKFFIHSFRPRHGNRWGSALLRKVYWLSWFKRADVKNWLRFGEKGAGSVLARYPDGSPPSTQQTALDAARAIVEESAIAVPKKFEIELLEHVRGGGLGSIYKELADDFCNNGIARVIRGQTLTSRGSEGGGSRALGEVHERVEETKTAVDAKSLMLAVNMRFVWPLTLFNFGPTARPPLWAIDYEPGNDLEQLSKLLERLWRMQVPIPRSFIYNTFPLPEPDGDEEVLPSPPMRGAQIAEDEEGGSGFAEKKTRPGASSKRLPTLPGSKMERFARLRPSMMARSAK